MSSIIKDWLSSAEQPSVPSDYKPFLGWSNLAQPVEGLDSTSYLELANRGVDSLKDKITSFCENNRLSYVIIPHDVYRQSFEKGQSRFRPWLQAYCNLHGLNANADIAIVGPCVKDGGSTEFKSKARQADRVRDYLRTMMIVLQGPTQKTAKKSLDTLADTIDTLQSDDRFATLARKNYLYSPKSNGYRAYKAAWNVPLPGAFSEWEMLAEIKIEHESQQDLNRMTRRFMGIMRQARDAMEKVYSTCSSGECGEHRNMHSNMSRLQHRVDELDAFSRMAYDYGHGLSGLNRFLDPNKRQSHPAVRIQNMQEPARKAIEAFGPAVAREIENAGLNVPTTPGVKFERTI